jgi:hypothetical protein
MTGLVIIYLLSHGLMHYFSSMVKYFGILQVSRFCDDRVRNSLG